MLQRPKPKKENNLKFSVQVQKNSVSKNLLVETHFKKGKKKTAFQPAVYRVF